MAAKTYKLDNIMHLVNPYQEKVSLNVALHAAFVVALQQVRFELGGDGLLRYRFKSLRYCVVVVLFLG